MMVRISGMKSLCRLLMAGLVSLSMLMPVAEVHAAKSDRSKKPAATKVAKKSGKAAPSKKKTVSAKKKTKTASAKQKNTRKTAKAPASANTRMAAARQGKSSTVMRASVPARETFGQRMGLRGSDDPLSLHSSVALVIDQDTSEVLFSKNESAVLPIASLTKLMTGLVVVDANLPMDEMITITSEDVDTYKGSSSRLAVGTRLTRGELMHLALMSSENRAAHALGRTFPGGMDHFVRLMNAKARELGMYDTRYVEPTGLMSQNQSSARDLATLVSVAYQRPLLRELSTSPEYALNVGNRVLQYRNSNRLVRNPDWDIGLQKTGYISEAGRCLVMQAEVAGRKLIMVFLDAAASVHRIQDAERVRHWVEAQHGVQPAARHMTSYTQPQS